MEQTSWRHITALLLSMSTSLVRDPELAPLLGSRYSLGDQLCPQAAPKEAQSEDKRDQGRHFRGRWGPTAGVSHPRATCGNWAAGPQPHRAGDRFALSSPLAAGQESQTEAALNLGRAEGRGRWAVGGACAPRCAGGATGRWGGACAPQVCRPGLYPQAVQVGTVPPISYSLLPYSFAFSLFQHQDLFRRILNLTLENQVTTFFAVGKS